MRTITRCDFIEEDGEVVVDIFRSPLEALDTAILRSSQFQQPVQSPLREGHAKGEWYGVRTPEDLRRACAIGLDDTLSHSLARTLSTLRTEETLRPVRRRWDVAGGSLSVPRYLSGDPMPFRHRVRGRARSRTLEIVILPTIDFSVTSAESEAIGRCMGQVLGLLTGMGYAIGISTLSLTRYIGTPFDHAYTRGAFIRIKDPSDAFNPRKISFALSRVLARALFIALVIQDTASNNSYARKVLPPTCDDDVFALIDELHKGTKVVFDANDLMTRLRADWGEERCVEYLLSSVTDHTAHQ